MTPGQNLFPRTFYVQAAGQYSACLVKQAKLMGVLYLENNLAPRVFTPTGLAVSNCWPLRPQSR